MAHKTALGLSRPSRAGPDGTGHDINLTAGKAQASVLPAGQGPTPAASTYQARGAGKRADTTQTRERAKGTRPSHQRTAATRPAEPAVQHQAATAQ